MTNLYGQSSFVTIGYGGFAACLIVIIHLVAPVWAANEAVDVGRVYELSGDAKLIRVVRGTGTPALAERTLSVGSLVFEGDVLELAGCDTEPRSKALVQLHGERTIFSCASNGSQRIGFEKTKESYLRRLANILGKFDTYFSHTSFRMPAASRAIGISGRMRCWKANELAMEEIHNTRQILLAGLEHLYIPDSLVDRSATSELTAADGRRLAMDRSTRSAPYFELSAPLSKGYYRVTIHMGGEPREWLYQTVEALDADVPAETYADAATPRERDAIAAVWLAARDSRYFTLAYSLLAERARDDYLADEMRIRLKSIVCED